jgi:hypothetical protein
MIKENGQNSRRRQYYESFLQGGFHLCLIEAHNKRLDEGMSAEESEEIMRMEEKILASSVGLKVTFPNRKPKQRKQ